MQLKLLARDSKAESIHALAQTYDLIGENDCVAIIGPAKSQTTKDVSTWLSKIPTKNRVVIGYSATSRELGGNKFANFVRTPPADDVVAKKMASLMTGLFVVELRGPCSNLL